MPQPARANTTQQAASAAAIEYPKKAPILEAAFDTEGGREDLVEERMKATARAARRVSMYGTRESVLKQPSGARSRRALSGSSGTLACVPVFNVSIEVPAGDGWIVAETLHGWCDREGSTTDRVRAVVEASLDVDVLEMLNENVPTRRGVTRVWQTDSWGRVYREAHPQRALRQNPWVFVDEGILGMIEGLNHAGAETLFSCQGHSDLDLAYVMLRDRSSENIARQLMGAWADSAGCDDEVAAFLRGRSEKFPHTTDNHERESFIEKENGVWRVRHLFEPQRWNGRRFIVRLPNRCAVAMSKVASVEKLSRAANDGENLSGDLTQDTRVLFQIAGGTTMVGVDTGFRESLERAGLDANVQVDDNHVRVTYQGSRGWGEVLKDIQECVGAGAGGAVDEFLGVWGPFWDVLPGSLEVEFAMWEYETGGWEYSYTAKQVPQGGSILTVVLPLRQP